MKILFIICSISAKSLFLTKYQAALLLIEYFVCITLWQNPFNPCSSNSVPRFDSWDKGFWLFQHFLGTYKWFSKLNDEIIQIFLGKQWILPEIKWTNHIVNDEAISIQLFTFCHKGTQQILSINQIVEVNIFFFIKKNSHSKT